jgi:hypothetical protein
MDKRVESLVYQCYHYIAMNLEKFPVSYLSLLPLKVREELLWRLPIADMCLLEDTEYVKGFRDMAAYWKLPCKDFRGSGNEDPDVGCYLEKWDDVEYAKEILYGQVVTAIIGCLNELVFYLPFDDELDPLVYGKDAAMIRFLYAVRKPSFRNNETGCELTFPHRYRENDGLTSKKDIIDAVISYFKGELPKIVSEVLLYDDMDNEYYDLLNKVVYLGVHGGVFDTNFVEQVVQRSTCLEVVILESYYEEEEEPTSMNDFVTFLTTQVSFLSNFQLLKVLTNLSGYSILQKNLNKLITAYFSAPTTHSQKIQFTDTEIQSYDDDIPPVIDQHYLQFKAIDLDNCHFILRQKSTHRAITQWLRQDISTLRLKKETEGEEANYCSFKVKERAPSLLGRKRKHSEVNSDDMEP